MSVPRPNAVSLSVGFAALGVSGLIYSGITVISMRDIGTTYVPVGEDWLWHVALPTVIYAALLALAFLTRSRTEPSLYGVATASVLLLFIGIHNAWDVAVSISVGPQAGSGRDEVGGDRARLPRPRLDAGRGGDPVSGGGGLSCRMLG
jgi:hypothetical protein